MLRGDQRSNSGVQVCPLTSLLTNTTAPGEGRWRAGWSELNVNETKPTTPKRIEIKENSRRPFSSGARGREFKFPPAPNQTPESTHVTPAPRAPIARALQSSQTIGSFAPLRCARQPAIFFAVRRRHPPEQEFPHAGSTTATAPLERVRDLPRELTHIRRDIHAHPELGLEPTARPRSWPAPQVLGHRGAPPRGGRGRRGRAALAATARARSGCAPTWMRCRSTSEPAPPTRATRRAPCTPAATTGTPPCCWRRATCRDAPIQRHRQLHLPAGRGGHGRRAAMLADGLLERFPSDELYGLHNRPGMPVGHFSITPGAAMAGGAFFDITVKARGAHGAWPNSASIPVVAACHIGTALQTVVARNLAPSDMGGAQRDQDRERRRLQRHPRARAHGRHGARHEARDAGPIEAGLKRVASASRKARREGRSRLPADLRPARQRARADAQHRRRRRRACR